jgi:lipopolysaccharide transport system permease protein
MSYINVHSRKLPFSVRYLADLFTYRHLCWNLVGADLRTRFRRSRIGILWAIIQPLAFALMIAAVWGGMFNVTDYWAFAIYVFSGTILWEFFYNVVVGSQDALKGAEGYLKQTRVPFLVFQLRIPFTSLVILLFAIAGLVILQAATQKLPMLGQHLMLIPAFLVLFMLFGIPLAVLMSIIGTQYRDVRHISQIAVQALFFISPVMLQRDILHKPELAFLSYVNPMVPLLDMFRAPVLYNQLWGQSEVVVVSIWIVALWGAALLLSAKVGRNLVFAL